MNPSLIAFCSCFISDNHEDRIFAQRLHDQLQGKGIRCWLDEHAIKPGDRMHEVVDEAIREHDRLLLCCSEASLNSRWVVREVRSALDREERGDRDISVPLDLPRHLLDHWQHGLAADLRSHMAAKLAGWETDNAKFEKAFKDVLKALRTADQDQPPPPKF